MRSKLEKYVENIVRHTESSRQEKEDLYEELLIHLQISRDHLMEEEGLSLEQAEEKAMQLFGQEGEIGSHIQQALFPYRKELMLALAISSILASISIYLLHVFVAGEPYIGWLCISMLLSSMILFLPLNQSIHLNRKLWLNSLLILHTLSLLYGWLLISQLNHSTTVGLTIWEWLNIALTIGLVYRTTLYDYSSNEKHIKFLHGINITSGIMISFASLFIIVGGLIMIGELHPMMLVFASPIAIWIGLYMASIKLAKKNMKSALFIGVIPLLLCVLILLWIYFPVLFD
ncbi:permease prefix domain 1-containing protein [Bacillus dakarensis]|uniref:permease prefix domain 1-containing protein n=1 Tax=Robertmurraya dakarensis TaxID=1926278 RepID=UPI000981DD1E|nr:permease prefix domain 1-containing protein [Bacillus dakarensis]